MIRSFSAFTLLVCLLAAGLTRADDANATNKQADSTFKMTKDEQTLLELINKERTKEKLPDLRPHPLLFKAARAHSANMAKQAKMEHVLDGKTPGQRVLAAGYDYGKVSENIAMSDGPGIPLPMIVKSWMESMSHRKNLLSDKVTETGLGLAKNGKGEIYYTQVFARPRKVIKPRKDP